MQDCRTCLAYNANIEMMFQNGALYGELTLLSTHDCSIVGEQRDTSKCCQWESITQQCGLSYENEVPHACAYCDGEIISQITFPKAEYCTACTKYYPEGSIDDPSGEMSSLTDHRCRWYGSFFSYDISNCCLYDEETERCGVFENGGSENGSFVFACGGVCLPERSPSSSPSDEPSFLPSDESSMSYQSRSPHSMAVVMVLAMVIVCMHPRLG